MSARSRGRKKKRRGDQTKGERTQYWTVVRASHSPGARRRPPTPCHCGRHKGARWRRATFRSGAVFAALEKRVTWRRQIQKIRRSFQVSRRSGLAFPAPDAGWPFSSSCDVSIGRWVVCGVSFFFLCFSCFSFPALFSRAPLAGRLAARRAPPHPSRQYRRAASRASRASKLLFTEQSFERRSIKLVVSFALFGDCLNYFTLNFMPPN